MTTPEHPLRLVEPVSLRSCLVRPPDVLYTEVAGAAVVWAARSRSLHELSPAAVALWAALDGRPLGELVGDDQEATGQAAIEMVRRLRTLGLVEDADGEITSRPLVEDLGPSRSVTLGAALEEEPHGARVTVFDDANVGSPANHSVVIDVPEGRVRHASSAPSAAVPISGFTVVRATESSSAVAPVELLGHLARATVRDAALLSSDLDALADLVERYVHSVWAVGPDTAVDTGA